MQILKSKSKKLNKLLEAVCESEFMGTGASFAEVFETLNPDGTITIYPSEEDSDVGYAAVEEGDPLIEFNGGEDNEAVLCLQFVIQNDDIILVYADIDGEVPEDSGEFLQDLADRYQEIIEGEDDEDDEDGEYDEDDEDDEDGEYDEEDDEEDGEFEFSESNRDNQEESFNEDDDEDDEDGGEFNISIRCGSGRRK